MNDEYLFPVSTRDEDYRAIVARQVGDEVLVDEWPRRIRVANGCLTESSPYFMRRDDLLTFTVDNGSAQYRLVERWDNGSTIWEGIE